MTNIPKQFSVLLKDNNGVLISPIQNKISSLSWNWDRIGGCGACKFKVEEKWDGALAGSFAEDYQVEIYVPVAQGTSELWYSGYIDKSTPSVGANDEKISVFCLGYVNQMKRAIVKDRTYVGQEISLTAKDAVEVYGTGITDITSAAGDYDTTDFAADTLYFNETLYETIQKLADIAGRREWGVNANKEFFFKAREDSTKHYWNITEDFESFKPKIDFHSIITRLYLSGGEGYKGTFTVTNRITTREKILTNSSIRTQSVGQQFARMYLKEKGTPQRSYTAKLIEQDTRIETTIPLGKADVNIKRGIQDNYDDATKIYDSGIKYDGGTESYQIDRIRYTLNDDNIDVNISFGVTPASIVEDLERFDLELTQERNV